MKRTYLLLTAALLLLHSTQVSAIEQDISRCVGDDGSVTYTSLGCPTPDYQPPSAVELPAPKKKTPLLQVLPTLTEGDYKRLLTDRWICSAEASDTQQQMRVTIIFDVNLQINADFNAVRSSNILPTSPLSDYRFQEEISYLGTWSINKNYIQLKVAKQDITTHATVKPSQDISSYDIVNGDNFIEIVSFYEDVLKIKNRSIPNAATFTCRH